MKYHRTEQISISIFLIISIILYFSFMFCDIFYSVPLLSNRIKFVSICLCLLIIVLRTMFHPKEKDYLILLFAFAFTVTADAFLLFTNHLIYGVLSFTIVQLLYLYRIHTLDTITWGGHLIGRIVISALVLVVFLICRVPVDSLLVVVTFYFLNFVGNLLLLGSLMKKRWKAKNCVSTENRVNTVRMCTENRVKLVSFLLGMILFFLCDLSVGFYNMSYYLEFHSPIFTILEKIAALGMWGFYLPGQILIALSTKRD